MIFSTKTYLLPAVALLSALMALTGCRSNKNSIAGQQYNGPQPSAQQKAQPSAQEWTNVYSSVNLDLIKPVSIGCGGKMTMERDKYIHLSLRIFGMEVAAVYIDNEQACFVNKYNKYVYAEPLKTVLSAEYSHLTLSDIQNIILGRMTLPDTGKAIVTPSKFVDTPAGQVASLITIFAPTPQATIEAAADWKPASASWNDPSRSVSFKIPDNYKRITSDNLRSILKNLSF